MATRPVPKNLVPVTPVESVDTSEDAETVDTATLKDGSELWHEDGRVYRESNDGTQWSTEGTQGDVDYFKRLAELGLI